MPDYISVTLIHKETIIKTAPCEKSDLGDVVSQLKEMQRNINGLLTDIVNSSGTENNDQEDCCEDDEDEDDEENVMKTIPQNKRRKPGRQLSPKKLKSV